MSTTGYVPAIDQNTLELACKYSIMAYEDAIPNAVKIESKWTSTTAYYIKGTEKTPDILAFRGTAQGIDWVTDALVIPVPFAGRLCHGGFTLAFLSVWGKIKKQLRMDHPLLICGHSLGGALAELAASKLHKKHKRP